MLVYGDLRFAVETDLRELHYFIAEPLLFWDERVYRNRTLSNLAWFFYMADAARNGH